MQLLLYDVSDCIILSPVKLVQVVDTGMAPEVFDDTVLDEPEQELPEGLFCFVCRSRPNVLNYLVFVILVLVKSIHKYYKLVLLVTKYTFQRYFYFVTSL